MESIFRVLAWVANISEEKDSYKCTRNLDMHTHSTIFDLPSNESDKNLVILESLKGT